MYVVTMRNNATGEVRSLQQEGEWGDYLWTEGNWSCDCNRAILFHGKSDVKRSCGMSQYVILQVSLEDGTIINLSEEKQKCST